MAKYHSTDLTELLCRNVRKELGKHIAGMLADVEPYIEILIYADAVEARVRILSETEEACIIFVRKVGEKLKCNPTTAFKIPPTLE